MPSSLLRVVFFGMEGVFSRAPLSALLAAGVDVRAVVVPRPSISSSGGAPYRVLTPPIGPARGLPVVATPGERSIIGIAWDAGIHVLEADRLSHSDVLAALRAFQPDLFCVACFPRLLPSALLALPRQGVLNAHPSLLPAYRGPSPLFWVFHDGLEHAGVTVHFMDAGADTGDIVARAPIALPDGVGYDEANRLCSGLGARLLVDAVSALRQGGPARRPQPAGAYPTAPAPGDADFVVTPAWPARRAFNFMRGMADWRRSIAIDVEGERLVAREALSVDPTATMDTPAQRAGAIVRVRCAPGVLTVTAP